MQATWIPSRPCSLLALAMARSRKDLFRYAAKLGLVEDAEAWFKFGDARNLSVHVYDSKQAEEVYQVACSFIIEARKLQQTLESYND